MRNTLCQEVRRSSLSDVPYKKVLQVPVLSDFRLLVPWIIVVYSELMRPAAWPSFYDIPDINGVGHPLSHPGLTMFNTVDGHRAWPPDLTINDSSVLSASSVFPVSSPLSVFS